MPSHIKKEKERRKKEGRKEGRKDGGKEGEKESFIKDCLMLEHHEEVIILSLTLLYSSSHLVFENISVFSADIHKGRNPTSTVRT